MHVSERSGRELLPGTRAGELTLGVLVEELFLSFLECAGDDELVHVRVGRAADRERGVDEAAPRQVNSWAFDGHTGSCA